MKSKKQALTKIIDLKELEVLIENENSCIRLQKNKDHLALHPYHLSDITNSVKEILNKRIGKFFARFDGILCGYKNITLLSDLGVMCDDSCFIHVDIEADFFIFKPTPEKMLHGIVNKKSTDHVGCLVHGVFNVSLPKPKDEENWLGASLNLGDEVELQITHTNFDRKLPYIKGEIISVVKKNVSALQLEEPLGEINPKKRKRTKKILFHDDEDDEQIKTENTLNTTEENETKDFSLGEDEEGSSPKAKKRKKKKKE